MRVKLEIYPYSILRNVKTHEKLWEQKRVFNGFLKFWKQKMKSWRWMMKFHVGSFREWSWVYNQGILSLYCYEAFWEAQIKVMRAYAQSGQYHTVESRVRLTLVLIRTFVLFRLDRSLIKFKQLYWYVRVIIVVTLCKFDLIVWWSV